MLAEAVREEPKSGHDLELTFLGIFLKRKAPEKPRLALDSPEHEQKLTLNYDFLIIVTRTGWSRSLAGTLRLSF